MPLPVASSPFTTQYVTRPSIFLPLPTPCRAFMRKPTLTGQVGTVALGTVVEGKSWRIKGLKGIRVVDSSTFPKITTFHPMATVYASAHHTAQLIKRQDR